MYTQPSINFNGFYSESELLDTSQAAYDMFDMGIYGFEQFQLKADQNMKSLERFADGIINSIPQVRKDILDQKSVALESTRISLDRSLKNQASLIATNSGGSAAMMLAQMNKQSNDMSMRMAQEGSLAVLKEDIERKNMYHRVVDARYGQANAAQRTLSGLITSWGATNTQMAQSGLQGAINTTRNLVSLRTTQGAQQIERDRMQLGWNQNLLNAQTSILREQMNFQLGQFQSMTSARAAAYDAEVRARTAIYTADVEANAMIDHAMIGARAGLMEAQMNKQSREEIATMNLGLGYHKVELDKALGALQVRSDALRALHGYADQGLLNAITNMMSAAGDLQTPNTAGSFIRNILGLTQVQNEPTQGGGGAGQTQTVTSNQANQGNLAQNDDLLNNPTFGPQTIT